MKLDQGLDIGPRVRLPGVVYPPAADLRRYRQAGVLGHGTLAEAFIATHAAHADRPALMGPEGAISHAQLDDITNRVAAAFLDLGLEPLDRVVFQVPNCNELMFGLLGCFKAGLIPVCTLVSHREHEIGYLAKHSGAKLHFVQGDDPKFDHVEFGERMRALAPTLRHLVVARGPARGSALSLRELIDAQDPVAARRRVAAVPRDPYQVALFQLSGGTTGVPKIIPRLNSDYLYNLQAVIASNGYRHDDVIYNPMPIIHNFNLVCCSGPTLLAGGAVALAPALDPDTVMGILRTQRPTWMVLPGPLFSRVAPALAAGELDFSNVRGLISTEGSGRIRKITGRPCFHVFGMTEGVIMFTREGDPQPALETTVGRPVSALDEVRILKPGTEDDVAPGETGESAFRGPYTIRGYYDAADRNAEAFTSDGFYRSGDLMSVREIDGQSYYVYEGRIKDVVSRGGEKINAEEVETAVRAHPDVLGCAVIGLPDREYGERMCACVVMRPGAPPLDVKSLGRHLEAYGMAKF
jgi:non-ribosomal peptide synthetase component E (peptide arylation enzyme)